MLISLDPSGPSSGSDGGLDPTETVKAEGQDSVASKELWGTVYYWRWSVWMLGRK